MCSLALSSRQIRSFHGGYQSRNPKHGARNAYSFWLTTLGVQKICVCLLVRVSSLNNPVPQGHMFCPLSESAVPKGQNICPPRRSSVPKGQNFCPLSTKGTKRGQNFCPLSIKGTKILSLNREGDKKSVPEPLRGQNFCPQGTELPLRGQNSCP